MRTEYKANSCSAFRHVFSSKAPIINFLIKLFQIFSHWNKTSHKYSLCRWAVEIIQRSKNTPIKHTIAGPLSSMQQVLS